MTADAIGHETLSVDRQNPWPGLEAFSEGYREFFFGRSRETGDIQRLVTRETLTVLFGQSGLGKTSLLQAGLFPLLREQDYLPIYIRLDHGEAAPALVDQVKLAIGGAARDAGAEVAVPAPDATLWQYFQDRAIEFWSKRNRLLMPVLVFDQFEEIFTLGARNDAARARGQAFLRELADLIENRPPDSVRGQIEEGKLDAARYVFDEPGAKVILSLREDYLANLEGLRPLMRSISQNRMRLLPMTTRQGLDVVQRAGGDLVEPEVARQIVGFVAGAAVAPAEDEGGDDLLEQHTVQPAILSLFCRELNNRRLARGQPRITADLLADSRDEIIAAFYERAMAQVPEAARAFVEDHLLTRSGYRDNMSLESALEEPGVTREALDALVRQRLLRVEERLGVQRIELTHDVLVAPVRASRLRRQQREELARAKEREAESAQRLVKARKRTIRYVAITGLALILLVCFTLVPWLFESNRKVKKQNQQIKTEMRRAEMEEEAAKAARKTAEEKTREARVNLAKYYRRVIEEIMGAPADQPAAAAQVVAQAVLNSSFTAPEAARRLVRTPAMRVERMVHLPASVRQLTGSRDGRWLAAVDGDNKLWLIDWIAGAPRPWPSAESPASVQSAAFSPEEDVLFVRLEDDTLVRWDYRAGSERGRRLLLSSPNAEKTSRAEHAAAADDSPRVPLPIAVSFDGSVVAAARADGGVVAFLFAGDGEPTRIEMLLPREGQTREKRTDDQPDRDNTGLDDTRDPASPQTHNPPTLGFVGTGRRIVLSSPSGPMVWDPPTPPAGAVGAANAGIGRPWPIKGLAPGAVIVDTSATCFIVQQPDGCLEISATELRGPAHSVLPQFRRPAGSRRTTGPFMNDSLTARGNRVEIARGPNVNQVILTPGPVTAMRWRADGRGVAAASATVTRAGPGRGVIRLLVSEEDALIDPRLDWGEPIGFDAAGRVATLRPGPTVVVYDAARRFANLSYRIPNDGLVIAAGMNGDEVLVARVNGNALSVGPLPWKQPRFVITGKGRMDADFNATGTMVAVAGEGRVTIYETAAGLSMATVTPPTTSPMREGYEPRSPNQSPEEAMSWAGSVMAFNPEGTLIAWASSALTDGVIADAASGKVLAPFSTRSPARALGFGPRNESLLVSTNQGLTVIDAADGRTILTDSSREPRAIYSTADHLVLIPESDGRSRLWEVLPARPAWGMLDRDPRGFFEKLQRDSGLQLHAEGDNVVALADEAQARLLENAIGAPIDPDIARMFRLHAEATAAFEAMDEAPPADIGTLPRQAREAVKGLMAFSAAHPTLSTPLLDLYRRRWDLFAAARPRLSPAQFVTWRDAVASAPPVQRVALLENALAAFELNEDDKADLASELGLGLLTWPNANETTLARGVEVLRLARNLGYRDFPAMEAVPPAIKKRPDYLSLFTADYLENKSRPLWDNPKPGEEDLPGALGLLNLAVNNEPTSYVSWLHRGIVLRRMRRYDEAIKSYNEAAACPGIDNVERARAFANMGLAYKIQGPQSYNDALKCFDKTVSIAPDFDFAYQVRGDLLEVMGEYARAADDLQKRIGLKAPDEAGLRFTRAKLLYLAKQPEAADAEMDRAMTLVGRDTYLAWTRKARTLRETFLINYRRAAADAYDKAISLFPPPTTDDQKRALAALLAERGSVHRTLLRVSEARADFQRSLDLDPKSHWALAELGGILYDFAAYPEAVAQLKAAVAGTGSNDDWAWNRLARATEKAGKPATATEYFQRAAELQAGWYLDLTGHHLRMGDTEAAERAIAEAMRYPRWRALSLILLGQMPQRKDPRTPEALFAEAEKAATADSSKVNRAIARALLGHFDEADADLGAVENAFPGDFSLHLTRAMLESIRAGAANAQDRPRCVAVALARLALAIETFSADSLALATSPELKALTGDPDFKLLARAAATPYAGGERLVVLARFHALLAGRLHKIGGQNAETAAEIARAAACLREAQALGYADIDRARAEDVFEIVRNPPDPPLSTTMPATPPSATGGSAK